MVSKEYPIHKESGNEDIRCAECGCYSPIMIIDEDETGEFYYYSCQCGNEWGFDSTE